MQEYPTLQNDSNIALADFIKRITELREEDMAEINELLRIRSYQSGFTHATKTILADYYIGVGDLFLDCDTSAGNITAYLPANPVDGELHHITKNDVSANSVRVDGNGININGTTHQDLGSHYDFIKVVYMGGSGEWRVL